jgi:hypothetical protein
MAKAGLFEAASIQVASGQIEVQTIDLPKLQRAKILVSSRSRRMQLNKVTGLRFH